MNNLEQSTQVTYLTVSDDYIGQRLDNFLLNHLKGVPKSHIYRIVRKGEIRINKKRIDVNYRLQNGDSIRIPPIRVAQSSPANFVPHTLRQAIEHGILFEDDNFLILNKPAGFAVHGGTGIHSGIIEGLRVLKPDIRFLELVHRLDKDTSGCLLIAKKRSALKYLHDLFRSKEMHKTYLALLTGKWAKTSQVVSAPLLKNVSKGGERFVTVHANGKLAETTFTRVQLFNDCTLVRAEPKTGRTHQIRVHAAHLGHPIVADERYGFEQINKTFYAKGHKRLFLHAEQLNFTHPITEHALNIFAPLPDSLTQLLPYDPNH